MSFTISEGKATRYAYAFIHEFFDTMGLPESKHSLNQLFYYAMETRVYRRQTPAMILFQVQQFAELITAAFVINPAHAHQTNITVGPTATGFPDMEQTALYISSKTNDSPWECFPRHLTAQQFFDPYLAVAAFCRYLPEREWQLQLKEITEYALGNGCIEIDETGFSCNLFIMQLRMLQLIEACWLIEVRGNS